MTASADDALSWLSARLTALLLMPPGISRSRTIAVVTPSSNGSGPMGTMALCLDVRFGKPGVYTPHASGHVPTTEGTALAVWVVCRAVLVAALMCMLAAAGFGRLPWL